MEPTASTDRGGSTAGGDAAAAELSDIERWFVRRGVPHFVESKTDGSILDAWTRALPLLIVAYFALSLNALRLDGWTVAENVAAGVAVIAIALVTWVLSNRLRGRPSFSRPSDIDAPELVLFVVGPALPVALFGQLGDAVETVVAALVLLAVIYIWVSYGLGPLARWGLREGFGQLSRLVPLVARALPLLLGVNTFLFINAEVWEMSGTLTGVPYAIVIGLFVGLGAAFSLIRMPTMIRGLNEFGDWGTIRAAAADTPAARLTLPEGPAERDPLTRRQGFNIGLMVLFGQAVQITLLVAALTGFFVLLGWLAIPEATTLNWTNTAGVEVLASTSVGDRTLVVTEPLIRVAVFLGAFSGMYLTVVSTTDETYRGQIVDDVGPHVRSALAARAAYRVATGSRAAPDPERTDA